MEAIKCVGKGIIYYLALMGLIISLSLFLFSCEKDNPTISNKIVDFDGNVYHSVIIGNQEWMVENLMTTHFNDGSDIKLITDDNEWKSSTVPSYCWYNNIIKLNTDNSALYNFYCVITGKLAPYGWHIPSDEEWKELELFIGMSEQEVDQEFWRGNEAMFLISRDWIGLPYGQCNQYGFSALPDGARNGYDAGFPYGAAWWTSTPYDDQFAWMREINGNDDFKIARWKGINQCGLTVRCIKNKQ